MAPTDEKRGNPAVLLVVLVVLAILAGALFWRLNRSTSSPQAAGVGPLGNNPAAGAAPADTKGRP